VWGGGGGGGYNTSKSNLCTTLTTQNTTEHECIVSQAENTTALQPQHTAHWSQAEDGPLSLVNCKPHSQYLRIAAPLRVPACLPSVSLYLALSTAGPRPGTGTSYQWYHAARGSPGICHFSFLSIGNILRLIIFVNVSKSSDPERLNNIFVANVSDQAAYF